MRPYTPPPAFGPIQIIGLGAVRGALQRRHRLPASILACALSTNSGAYILTLANKE